MRSPSNRGPRRSGRATPGWRVESERRRWPHIAGRPHPLLGRFLTRGYVGVTRAISVHQLLIPATASVPLVVKIEDSAHRPPAFLHGVHDRSALMDGNCAASYLEVLMAPLGAYRLLGMPVTELGHDVVDLEQVFGAAGRRFQEAIRDEPTWQRRFVLLDEFLLTAARSGPTPCPEVRRAWQLLERSGGTLPIKQVTQEIGWSHKHLITRFVQQVGLTPKTAARLVRFERVVERVTPARPAGWDRIAVESGYADQAHLIRDFHAFAGVTPTDFARRTETSSPR